MTDTSISEALASKPEMPLSFQKLQLPALAASLPIGIYTCDAAGTLIQYNRQCEAIWGARPQPGSGKKFTGGAYGLYDIENRSMAPAETPMAEAVRTGKPVPEREVIVERPDGSRVLVQASAEPVFGDDGEIIGSINCLQEITERRQIESGLAHERQILDAIMESTPDCIQIVARDGTLLQINPAGLRMIEAINPEGAVGASVFNVIAPEDRATWKANHERVCNGEKLAWEFDIIGAAGTRRRAETHAVPLRLPDNTWAQLAITRDITQRKDTELSASESEYRYRQLLQALPTAIYTTDAAGKITFYNQAAVELAGRTPELGSDEWCVTWRLYQADGTPLPHDQCPMAVALKEKRRVTGSETIAERPDGSRAWFIPFPTPLFDSSGQLTGAVNMLIDVTDRQQAEFQSAKLAAIVASSDDAIVGKTLDGIITSWNAGATRIFGYTAEEMIGQHIERIIPPELRSEEDRILAALRRGEHVDHFETVRIGKSGQRINISATISPIRDKYGRLVGASKVGRDITERKQAEKLQQLLMGELNHRVKNTLATVQSIANQTVHNARSPSEFAASFGGRIQSLARTHSLLTASTWQGAELSALLRDQLMVGESGDDRVSYAGPSVMLNPQAALHLSLVLHELATNARKYGALSDPRGKLSIKWMVRTNTERELLLQWQERDGPAVTVPQRRGFGTSLIEKSLEAHGGAASVRYEGEGLTCDITLTLPQSEQSGTGSYKKLGTAKMDLDQARLAEKASVVGKRILVVDDEPLIAMDMVSSLEDEGCVVVGPAATLEKAMALIDTTEIDAAMLDANLGGKPVDAIAAALVRRNIPFAFVSGYGREGLPEAFRQAMLIRKPFQHQRLIEVIQQMVQEQGTVVQLRKNF
jgi:PAS domain S-box-containing protein